MIFVKLISFLSLMICNVKSDYWTDRNDLIAKESSLVIGSDIVLTNLEQQANDILMTYKYTEFDQGFNNPSTFAPARHFFNAKSDIENSAVFNIIRILPKGASLHSHDTALASGEYVYNLTYSDNLYACTENGRLTLRFFNEPDDSCAWNLLSEIRASNSTYDDWLKTQINIIVDNPNIAYTDINQVWSSFIDTFVTVEGMLTYKEVWKSYFYKVLQELYEDNVMYIEFRTTLPECYDLDGTTYGRFEVAGFYKEVVDQFKLDFPDFQGARIIYAPVRAVDNATIDGYVNTALQLREQFGDFLAGFDLVGQEDLGRPLDQFINQLKTLLDAGMRLFCHAGETNWYGSTTDFNVIDAVLLNATRIGHGYALLKHSEALRIVKEKGIGIEVNPLSNQVLKLVADIRNHPAVYYIANGYPVIISNDDPSFWGARGLSYDWYLAFMGMTSRNTDLRFLKQLALNSYIYNVMPTEEKNIAILNWNDRWNSFIEAVIARRF